MATAPDISKLSYSELKALLEATQEQIEDKRTNELNTIADGYIKKGQSLGFTVQELVDALGPYQTSTTARKRTPKKTDGSSDAPVKYRDPKTGETWSGRGRAARWLAAYEAAGRSRDEFLVK